MNINSECYLVKRLFCGIDMPLDKTQSGYLTTKV